MSSRPTEIGAGSESRSQFANLIRTFSNFGIERPVRLVVWTIVIGTVMRLFAAAAIGFGNGEAYYLATARHLALSYFDQPPLFLWIVWATMKLTGSEWVFVLRVPFVLMFIATTWLMYRLGAVLFNERAGAFGAFLLNLSPVFTISVGGWMQPDGPLMLTLLAGALCLARLAFDPSPRTRTLLWLAAGFWLGLALLAKYHTVLVVLGIVAFALISRAHRRWFAEPGPYLGALIALALFSPVLIWNWQNGGVSFGFQGGRIVESEGIRPDWLLRSLLGQAAWIGPWIWVPMIQSYALGLMRGPRDIKSWFLCCAATLPIFVFTIAALWAPLGWHFHWQAPGYLLLFPLLGSLILEQLNRGDRGTRIFLFASAVGIVAIVLVLVSQAMTGWMRYLVPSPLAPIVKQINDPTVEGHDWKEVREAVRKRGLLTKQRLFAVGGQWFEAGKVDVQLGRNLPVVCLCEDPRNIAFGWDHRNFAGWDALIIGTDHYVGAAERIYGPYFRKIELLERVDIYRGGAIVVTIPIFYATDYYRPYPLPLPPPGSR